MKEPLILTNNELSTDALPGRAYYPMLEWARRDGDRVALIEGQRHLSYAELASASEDAARELAARGVRPGDRVLIVCENGIGAVIFLVATQRLDAWPAMVSARLPVRDVEGMRATARARLTVLITDNSAASAAHTDGSYETVSSERFGRVAFGRVDVRSKAELVHPENYRQVGLMLFTSGTTGKPKAVMVSHRAMLNAGSSLVASRRLRGDDVFYGGSPLSHILGGSAILSGAFWAGCAIKLLPRLEIVELCDSIVKGEITYLMAVPMVYARIINHARAQGLNFSHHRMHGLMAGGAPLDPTLADRIADTFGLPLGNGYSMTECTPIARTPAGVAAVAGSVGIAEGGTEIRLVTDGRDADLEEVGEIWVRGPSLMIGYYRDTNATDAAMREDGWFSTGDLGRRLVNGELAIVGRSKEMIIHSGFNVYPAEVEAVVLSHPGVAQCAVVGRRIDYGNEEVVAFVQLLAGQATVAEEIQSYAASLLAPYKRPTRVVIVIEMPVGSTGKILKSQLAGMAASLT